MIHKISKQMLIGVLTGGVVTLSMIFVGTMLVLLSLPAWKSHWLLETTRLLPIQKYLDLNNPQVIYSSPSSWDSIQSNSSPYIYHKNRTIKYDSSQNQSQVYIDKLKSLAETKEAAIYREEFLLNRLSEIKLLPKKERTSYLHFIVRNLAGYIPTVEPSYEVYRRTTELIWLKGRYGANFRSLILSTKSPKGVVIAIHGRGGSPEGVIGKVDDYSNSFGKFWHNAGYNVFAPDVQPQGGLNFPRLGLSSTGADIAIILDLAKYIKHKYGRDMPVIVAGISYGSKLAEMTGILSDDINAVISIGGSARYNYMYSMHSLPSTTPFYSHYLNSLLNSGGIYDLILPKKLVISVGNYDAGNWGRDGENKIHVLNSFLKRNIVNESYKINLFKGIHESDPIGEINSYEQLVTTYKP